MEQLSNELLFEILCRLPCYSTAVRFKTVSKRWCSLISDPLFASQGYSMHRKIKEENPSWALLLTTRMRDDQLATSIVTPPHTTRKLGSPILSFEFLPYSSKVVATFRDLVLCFRIEPLTQVGMFYVCNPLTKQWMALPPSESHKEPELLGAALVCQDNGAFRVVVIHSVPNNHFNRRRFRDYKSVIYLSETREWKDVDIKIHRGVPPGIERAHKNLLSVFVCNGMVCIDHYLYFGAFNPFDVTSNSSGTLTAIRVPSPDETDKILECSGKLIAVNSTIDYLRRFYSYDSDYEANVGHEAENLTKWLTMGLNLNLESDEETLRWEQVSVLRGNIKVNRLISAPFGTRRRANVVGVHPNKEHLIYLFIKETNQLVLFDTKLQTLDLVTCRISPYDEFVALNKLELPCWPTPVVP